MTAPVSNGNIRNFDETLERCLQAIERGQATVESCVTRFPEYQELGETLRMAIAVRSMPRPQMPAAAATPPGAGQSTRQPGAAQVTVLIAAAGAFCPGGRAGGARAVRWWRRTGTSVG
jgi:hypothetical protein